MNVYITYNRYGRDEWFAVYNIDTNKQKAIKNFKEESLLNFLGCGPDDCHSFQLQKVVLTKTQYKHLCKLADNTNTSGEDEEELRELLISFFDEDDEYDVETLMQTDGCSDNLEIAELYCERMGISEDDYEAREEARVKVWDDEELFLKYYKEYVSICY